VIKPYVHIYRENGILRRAEVVNADGTRANLDRITGVEWEQGHHDPGKVTITLVGMRVRFHEEDIT
jgi:hypothetical protein